jgi:hypothetical protein
LSRSWHLARPPARCLQRFVRLFFDSLFTAGFRAGFFLAVLLVDFFAVLVGGVMALFHPGTDVVAALDLPFVDARRVAERLQLLGNPKRPVAIARCIADENIRHATLAR